MSHSPQPDIVQSFDYYIDREYYKIVPGFIFDSKRKVRADRLEEWKQWNIHCDILPDEILINGEKYTLTKQLCPSNNI